MSPIALEVSRSNPRSPQNTHLPPDSLVPALKDLPHQFLQPSSALYANALSTAKQYLDPIAAHTSQLQHQRQQLLRRKRKRGESGRLEESKPLALTQIHTEGFEIDQIWAQAKRILDATTFELQRSVKALPADSRQSQKTKSPGNGNGSLKEAAELEDTEPSDVDGALDEDLDESSPSDENLEERGGDERVVIGEDDVEELEDEVDGMEEAAEEVEGSELYGDSDPDEEQQEVFKPDKLGLNDGFFSIDDFNRQSEFLEQQDVRGEDDGAASDEEDVDWDADPLSLGAGQNIEKARASRDPLDAEASDDDGPTFGNADLNGPDDSDFEQALDIDDAAEDMDGMQNTNDILYANFFEPPPRKLTKSTRRRALPKTQPPPMDPKTLRPSEEDMQRTISSVRRDIFEDDLTPSEGDSDAGSAPGPRSSHQKRQAALTKEIQRLEAEAVAKKSWTLSGEARAGDRPLNSLLEEDLEFERAGKPVPVITQEVSEDIEALIKRRIINREFDEVTKRRPDSLTTASGKDVRRGRVELDDGKPQQSLAEIYEAEHLKNADPEGYVDKRSEKLTKEYEKIEALWRDVSAKLDALCNLNFRPKPPEASVNVVTDVPTIMMEDARPNAGADLGQSRLAPQEVYKAGEGRDKKAEVSTKGGLPVGREEMTREEKLRRRRREKERIKKAGGVPLGAVGKANGAKSKKNEEKDRVVKDLKRGGVRVIGKKGEIRDTEGREVKSGANARGAGAYKL